MITTADIAREYGLSERQVRHLARVQGFGEIVDRPDGRGPMRVFSTDEARWFGERPPRGRRWPARSD